jgi:hypothetical protein
MKHYFIADREIWERFPKEQFDSSHCIETTDPTKLLIVVTFSNQSAHELWERTEGVEALPHLLWAEATVSPRHQKLLEHLNVKTGDRTWDVAHKAAVEHPLFRPDRD